MNHLKVDLLCIHNVILSNMLGYDVHPANILGFDMEYKEDEIYSAIITDNGVCFLLQDEDNEDDTLYYSRPYNVSDIANYFEVVSLEYSEYV